MQLKLNSKHGVFFEGRLYIATLRDDQIYWLALLLGGACLVPSTGLAGTGQAEDVASFEPSARLAKSAD